MGEKPNLTRKINLGLRAAVVAAGVLGVHSESGEAKERPRIGAAWEQSFPWIRPIPGMLRERAGGFIVIREPKRENTTKLLYMAEGGRSEVTIPPEDVHRAHQEALKNNVIAQCDVHSHPERLSPPSVEDVRQFHAETKHLRGVRPGVIHTMGVVDQTGTWFVREFISESEQEAVLRNSPLSRDSLKMSGADQLERLLSRWRHPRFQERISRVEDVWDTPDYLLLVKGYARVGVRIVFVSHGVAAGDPCGLASLYRPLDQ